MIIEEEGLELKVMLDFISYIRIDSVTNLNELNRKLKYLFNTQMDVSEYDKKYISKIPQVFFAIGRYVEIEIRVCFEMKIVRNEVMLKTIALDYYTTRNMLTMDDVDFEELYIYNKNLQSTLN